MRHIPAGPGSEQPLKLFPVLLADVHRCRRSTRIRWLHSGRDRNGGAENLSALFLFAHVAPQVDVCYQSQDDDQDDDQADDQDLLRQVFSVSCPCGFLHQ